MQFKSLLIKTVLATDMSNHFEIVAKFQQKFSSFTNWGGENGTGQMKTITENAALLIQMTVKAADIGHCYARIEQHLYWSKCLEDEFFQQGDLEREAHLPISPLMDRYKQGRATLLGLPARVVDFLQCCLYLEINLSLKSTDGSCGVQA